MSDVVIRLKEAGIVDKLFRDHFNTTADIVDTDVGTDPYSYWQ